MKSYFALQFRMTGRKLRDFGLHPLLCILLILPGFLGASFVLFYKIPFAAYIYLLIPLIFMAKLSEQNRNDFLRLLFKKKRYYGVRVIENLLVSLPFLIFLVCQKAFLPFAILALLPLFMTLVSFKTQVDFTLPTPFSKRPFEFTVGFRNNFYVIFLAYGLCGIAVSVDNFNLAIFSLAPVFLVVFSFYTRAENDYFVWNFSLTPKQFLLQKLKTGVLFTAVLCLPLWSALFVFYPENRAALILFSGMGFTLLITVILAKYAAYPDDMNVSEGIMIAIALTLPPLLLVFIPYFYSKASNKLKHYLP